MVVHATDASRHGRWSCAVVLWAGAAAQATPVDGGQQTALQALTAPQVGEYVTEVYVDRRGTL